MATPAVQTGLDKLFASNFEQLKDQRLGIICNPSAVDCNLQHIVDLMVASDNCNVVKLFAPEHGVRGDLQDMEHVENIEDPKTQLPVISLYGNSLKSLTPANEAIEDLDTLVFDIQDVGSRYYTYAQTLAFTMMAAEKNEKKVVVIDRPNPIDGLSIEGTPLNDSCRSFCGLYPLPNRHGLTMGELAMMYKRGYKGPDYALAPVDCDLEVIKMDGWSREMFFTDTGLPWVQPSPNMPTLDTALVYPGMCLFEGTNLSEGRGTTKPFELLGAPFIDGHDWAEETQKQNLELEGAVLRPLGFVPKFSKFGNKHCGGLQLHITDAKTFQSYRWALALIAAAASLYPDKFNWRQETYEFVKDTPAIDLLYGSNNLRKVVETKKDIATLNSDLEKCEADFLEKREDYFLY
jgi:uncharacterized protein YbbC (DUF1343 family)